MEKTTEQGLTMWGLLETFLIQPSFSSLTSSERRKVFWESADLLFGKKLDKTEMVDAPERVENVNDTIEEDSNVLEYNIVKNEHKTIDKLTGTKSQSGDAPPPKACHIVD